MINISFFCTGVFYEMLNQEKVEAGEHVKIVSVTLKELHLDLKREGRAFSKGLPGP